MASGGRILHHLHNHLADPRATVIFPGYQGAGTLGYLLAHGRKACASTATRCRFAKIVHLSGFSRACRSQRIPALVRNLHDQPHLYAVHGEVESATAVATLAHAAFGWPAEVAQRGTTIE